MTIVVSGDTNSTIVYRGGRDEAETNYLRCLSASLPKGKHNQAKQKQHVCKLLCHDKAHVQALVAEGTPLPPPIPGTYIPNDYGGLYTVLGTRKTHSQIF